MKAIILAAGIGKRMQPVQKDKCLMKFLGKELILHQIEMLERCGIKEFIIVCNPRSMEKIKKLAGEKVEYVIQREANGMADALLSIKNPPKEVLIVGISDLIEESAYENILKKKEGDAIILGYRVKEYFPGGYLITEGEKVKGVVEKPGEGNEPSNLVNIVVHVHKKFDKLLEYMKNTKSDSDDVYELSMARMMKEGYDFRFVSYDGTWVPIKYPWHILDATKFFLDRIYNKISRSAEISKKVTITGKVFIDDGVKILENAVIRGPCYIGKNSVIGNGTLVCGGSHIGERCVIGFVSEVKHSYLGDNVWLHRNYVGDSIIMDNCNFGAGTAVANWRFDKQPVRVNVGSEKISTGMEKFGCVIGENCKIGINVSIMPGIKIGPNATVGAHLLVSKDVGSGKFVSLKQVIEEIENVK
jgi:bifunctional UDP-N-acetylglucosamine pyrophosphorylase / glucosamine-1-phosphate N-acetyltransferase